MAKPMKKPNIDRISILPEELRQHIISFLSGKEAIKTSVLSSSWRYVWLNLPTLVFDRSIFVKRIEFRRQNELLLFKDFINKEAEKLRSFILLFLDFLDRLNFDLEKGLCYTNRRLLDLYLCTLPEFYPRIVSLFKRLKVNELRLALNFGLLNNEKDRDFLESIGEIQELTSLSLCIGQSGHLTRPLRLPSRLQNLSLQNLCINDAVTVKLFDSNSSIESLSFDRCSGFTELKVSRLPRLKTLVVLYNSLIRLEIDALPSLCALTYYLQIDQRSKLCVSKSINLKVLILSNYDLEHQFGNSMNHLTYIKMVACKNLHAFNVKNCKSLSTLILDACEIKDDCFDKFIEKLPIKYLTISHCDLLEKINISLGHLRVLALPGNDTLHRVEINCPNLCKFKHLNFNGLIFLSSVTPFPPTLVDLWLPDRRNHSAEQGNLLQLFKNLRNCKRLTLRAYYIEDLMIIRRMRQSSCPPLNEVQQLKVKLIEKKATQSLAKFVDALLWLLPQLVRMRFVCSLPSSSSIDFELKHKLPTMFGAKTCGCHGSIIPINCWRHSVENFVMQEKIGFEDDYSVESFFEGNSVTQLF